jgi:signal transduction histidine kinase
MLAIIGFALHLNRQRHQVFIDRVALKIATLRAKNAALRAEQHAAGLKRGMAQVAHEFGTPLQSLQASLECVQAALATDGDRGMMGNAAAADDDDTTSETTKNKKKEDSIWVKHVEVAESCCWSLSQLREMMMNDAKVQIGHALQPRQETMDLGLIVDRVSTVMASKMDAHELTLRCPPIVVLRSADEPVRKIVTDQGELLGGVLLRSCCAVS